MFEISFDNIGIEPKIAFTEVEIPRKNKLIIDQMSVKKGAIIHAFFCSINNEVYLTKIIL